MENEIKNLELLLKAYKELLHAIELQGKQISMMQEYMMERDERVLKMLDQVTTIWDK